MQNREVILQAYHRLPIEIIRGEGVYLYDSDNKRYLDFASGIAVTNMGHVHQYMTDALLKQAKTLWHCSNLFTIPDQQRLAQRLVDLSFADKVFFCSSGVEAVEASIKFMRKYHYEAGNSERVEIISLEGGFHGRSLTTLAAGGNEAARAGFRPLVPGFTQVERENIEVLKAAIGSTTAGILLEPVQSEGGVYPLDPDYLRAVRQLATEEGILLCFDEVQTGYGRTGSLFAYEQYGIEPDVMALAKGMGNGFPLGASLLKEEVAQAITPGTHGSTYGGNPLAMAVGNAVLDRVEDPKIHKQVRERSHYFVKQLHALQAAFPDLIVDIRSKGLLIGIEVSCSATVMLKCAIAHGLAVTKCGSDRVLRLLPPLIIEESHIDEAMAIITRVCKEVTANA